MELRNIDLEITFPDEPSTLLSEVGESLFVLFSGWRDDVYLVILEVNLTSYTEEEILRTFFDVRAKLSKGAKRDLSKALKREFNFGYALATNEPLEVSIPHPVVRLIADTGYSIGVTLYRPD